MTPGGILSRLSERYRIRVLDAPMPAIRLDAAGGVVEQSQTGGNLCVQWQTSEDGLMAVARDARETGLPQEARLGGDTGPAYWVIAVKDGDSVVLLARDTTLADKVTSALIQSRTMLRCLLDQAVDLAFQTDAAGRFRFVTPSEAFGFDTSEWIGQSARTLFWTRGDSPGTSPFETHVARTVKAVPVSLAGQERRFFDFELEPETDAEGVWRGVRGICRDVTEAVAAARDMRQTNLRLMVQSRITQILNSEERSEAVLDRAAKTMLEILRAEGVWILSDIGGGLVPVAVEGVGVQGLDMKALWRSVHQTGAAEVASVEAGGREMLAVRLVVTGGADAVMVIARDTGASPWSAEERALLTGVGDVLAAAMAKASLIDRLYYLSSRDELTGILNRRALGETISRRLRHQSRTGLSGVLLFIDLDHFKEVNDTLGHRAGDDALKGVADHLQESIRPCDHAGRYGGDEFVVWFEDMSVEAAVEKGRALIDHMADVRKAIGGEHLKLSASVGVAKSLPGTDEAFEPLAERADAALYEIKKAGKGDVAIADLPDASEQGV